MVNQLTTIHQFQRSLFHLVDRNINVKIEKLILTACLKMVQIEPIYMILRHGFYIIKLKTICFKQL